MDLIGSSRLFGFATCMCTSTFWEKRSALCTLADTTDSFGASNFAAAQPPSSAAIANMPARPVRRIICSRMPMREHVGGHENHTLLGHEEALGVFGAIDADTRA